jgi:hypothetical protein
MTLKEPKKPGRPPGKKLPILLRLQIASRYENWLREKSSAKVLTAHEKWMEKIRRLQAEIEEQSARIGKQEWLATERAQELLGLEDEGKGDIYDAILEAKGLTWEEAENIDFVRVSTLHPKYPKNERESLYRLIAKEFSVTERMVRSCVEEFRREGIWPQQPRRPRNNKPGSPQSDN